MSEKLFMQRFEWSVMGMRMADNNDFGVFQYCRAPDVERMLAAHDARIEAVLTKCEMACEEKNCLHAQGHGVGAAPCDECPRNYLIED